jgi:hypothetical protein
MNYITICISIFTGHYTICCKKKSQSCAPEDGQTIARNMLSWSWRSIKLLLLHLVGVPYYFTYIDVARSNTNQEISIFICYVHVTVRRNKFLYNKTNQMHQFHKFTPAWNFTCFGHFLCPSSGVYSVYFQPWYMSYRFVDSFRAGVSSSILSLLESCLQTCMT